MSSTRLYIGNLDDYVRERDVKDFFRGYGKITEILLKKGYGFVEFDDYRDAEDAIDDLDGKKMCGRRISVEKTRGIPRGSGKYYSGRKNGGRPPPRRTKYRVVIENLSSRVSWQDLKDYVSTVVSPTFADAHKKYKDEGIVEFASYSDMKIAIAKLDRTQLRERTIRVFEDPDTKRMRSVSRRRGRSLSSSRSRRSSLSRSRSRTYVSRRSYLSRSRSRSYLSRSRSRSYLSRSRSRSYLSRSRSRRSSLSRSRSRSYESRSRRSSLSQSRSRSRSILRSKSRGSSLSKSCTPKTSKSRSPPNNDRCKSPEQQRPSRSPSFSRREKSEVRKSRSRSASVRNNRHQSPCASSPSKLQCRSRSPSGDLDKERSRSRSKSKPCLELIKRSISPSLPSDFAEKRHTRSDCESTSPHKRSRSRSPSAECVKRFRHDSR